MALVLNEEQKLLKESVKDFFDSKAKISALRKIRDEGKDLYDENLWKEMCEMGLTGLIIPENYGGLNFGYVALGQVLELIGRNLVISPLISTSLMSTTVINTIGNENKKKQFLEKIALGEITVSFAYQEKSNFDPYFINTIAESDGDNYIINGEKFYVLDANISDYIIALVKIENGSLGCCIINSNAEGLKTEKTEFMDTRNRGNIEFNNVSVSKENFIEIKLEDLDKIYNIISIGISSEMLGISIEAFERTIQYLKEREQFGVPIGSFQALQHRAAKMFIEIELSKSVVFKALKAIDDNSQNLSELASLCKSKLGKTVKLVTNEAIQMHGGIGMTDDIDIGLFIKRARVAQQSLGDYNYHLNRYADISGY